MFAESGQADISLTAWPEAYTRSTHYIGFVQHLFEEPPRAYVVRGFQPDVWSVHTGAPDKKLLGEIEAVLQKKREIAVDVEVKAPTEKTVNVSAELTAEQGWTMQEITDAATAALQAYFTGERLGEAVYTAKLANILYGVEGVKNCHLLTPSADVSVSATELPVLGTVTITEIGAGEA